VDTAGLSEELRNIVDHAEALLDALSDEGDARLAALYERVSDSIDTARARLAEINADADRPSERAAAAFERWMTENPWIAVAIGAGVGMLIGVLLSRRRAPAPRDAAAAP
jgi:ElaB/YqjD/DUF883 family membrane-anchored ribosome-binding protein